MVRSAAKKVMWVGRATVFMVGLAVVLALVFGAATAALGAPMSTFKLGQINTSNAISILVGAVSGSNLKIENTSTAANATALELKVDQDNAPLAVNAEAGKATNLNADKVDGQEASAFLAANGKAADSELLDGKNSSDFASAYKRTVVVSPVPGDPVASGTALKQALANLENSGNPSENNPFLLKIEPGVYNVGNAPNDSSNGLLMRSWVDIEGSGQGVTTITAAGNDVFQNGATVTANSNAELRSLTVKNTGGADSALAISASVSPIRVTNVTASASGGNRDNTSVIVNPASTAQLREVTANASGSGANVGVLADGTLTLTDVTTNVSGGNFARGINSNRGTVQVHHSEIAGSDHTIFSDGGSVLVGASQLDGGAVFNATGTIKCVASYDENFNALGDNCV